MLSEKRRPREASREARHSPFVSRADGLGELIDALRRALCHIDVRTDATVESIERCGDGYCLTLASGQRLDADAVVLATPAPAAARLLRSMSQDLADTLSEISCVSPVTVSIAFDAREIGGEGSGRGFVIPRSEGRALTAVTWSSNKFDGRAPADVALLRAFLGKAGREETASLSDEQTLDLVLRELASILGITAPPLAWRVYRWPDALPQYNVSHQQRVARINALTAGIPDLALVGSAYQGVGIPDCIHHAATQAHHLADRLDAGKTGRAIPLTFTIPRMARHARENASGNL